MEIPSIIRSSSAAIADATNDGATRDESDGHHELRNAAVPNDVPTIRE